MNVDNLTINVRKIKFFSEWLVQNNRKQMDKFMNREG